MLHALCQSWPSAIQQTDQACFVEDFVCTFPMLVSGDWSASMIIMCICIFWSVCLGFLKEHVGGTWVLWRPFFANETAFDGSPGGLSSLVQGEQGVSWTRAIHTWTSHLSFAHALV